MIDFKNESGNWLQNYNGKITRSGTLWNNLKQRLKNTDLNKNKSYTNCSIEFEDFQNFAQWCCQEENYLTKDSQGRFYCLDKDILFPDNTIYSGTNCCFIPQELNMNLSRGNNKTNRHLMGCTSQEYKGKITYIGQINSTVYGKQYLGSYSNEFEAHRAWQIAKIGILKQLKEIYSFLPEKIISGLDRHIAVLQADYDNQKATILG